MVIHFMFKDNFGISDKAYLVLCSASNLPAYKIRNAKAHLDQSNTVTPTPSDAIGFQIGFVQWLRILVQILYFKHIVHKRKLN